MEVCYHAPPQALCQQLPSASLSNHSCTKNSHVYILFVDSPLNDLWCSNVAVVKYMPQICNLRCCCINYVLCYGLNLQAFHVSMKWLFACTTCICMYVWVIHS